MAQRSDRQASDLGAVREALETIAGELSLAAVVSTVPGGGWLVRWRQGRWVTPVVAWVTYSDGTTEAHIADSNGNVGSLSDAKPGSFDLIPPGVQVQGSIESRRPH